MTRLSRRQAIAAGVASLGTFTAGSAWARQGAYFGDLILRPLDDGRRMELLKEFGYRDGSGQRWAVPAGSRVDGASIPPVCWPFIGGPWEGRYRNASVVHDYFCDRRSRTSAATHRVFHEAMLTSGVEKWRADVMYTAVKVGGPKWSDTVVHNNELADINDVFALGRSEIDATAKLATATALSATTLQISPSDPSAGDGFALLAERLPPAPNLVWSSDFGQSSSATLGSSGGLLTARILGSRGEGVVIGLEEQLPLSEADFETIKDSVPAEGLPVDNLDEQARSLELGIRSRRLMEATRRLTGD